MEKNLPELGLSGEIRTKKSEGGQSVTGVAVLTFKSMSSLIKGYGTPYGYGNPWYSTCTMED